MAPRIFHSGPLTEGTDIILTGGAAAHLSKVLRVRVADSIIVFNGDGSDYRAQIISTAHNEVAITIGRSHEPRTESPITVILLQGICRNPRMDILIQKSTELGIREIRPIVCERSVVKIGEARKEKKLQHWEAIAISACEQSGRAQIPKIRSPDGLAAALEQLDTGTARLMLDPSGSDTLRTAVESRQAIALLIGPEGGLTDGEQAAATDAGFKQVRLGPRILRTETAPIAAISIIQYLFGDLDNE